MTDETTDATTAAGSGTLSAAELRAVYNSVGDAIFIHDRSGDIIDVNQAAVEMYGYSRSELRAGNVGAVSSGEPPYTETEAKERLDRAADGGPQTFEWQGRDSDGDVFWKEVSLSRATGRTLGPESPASAPVRSTVAQTTNVREERLRTNIDHGFRDERRTLDDLLDGDGNRDRVRSRILATKPGSSRRTSGTNSARPASTACSFPRSTAGPAWGCPSSGSPWRRSVRRAVEWPGPGIWS